MENLIKECLICSCDNIQYKETEAQYGYYCNDCYNFGVYTFKENLGICCKKPNTVIYELTQSNGVSIYRNVCLNCWDNSKNIKKSEALGIGIYDKSELSAITQLKEEKHSRSLWSYFAKLKNDEAQNRHDNKTNEWWDRYKAYLNTDKWKQKSKKVLERDKYLCQACLERPATQAHHRTYKNVGSEPLFQLISVCKFCHDYLHALKLKDDGY